VIAEGDMAGGVDGAVDLDRAGEAAVVYVMNPGAVLAQRPE
jgi:hypothetical protein